MRFIALLALAFLSACNFNDARVIEGRVRSTPASSAVIIFGVRAEEAPRHEVRFRFEQEDAQRSDCSAVWTRLEVRVPPRVEPMRYYAFVAPPGRYQLFGFSPEDFRSYEFEARAGRVQYAGDFSLQAEPYVTHSVNAEAAAAFAAQRGLSAPETVDVEITEGIGRVRYCTF